MNLLGRLNGTVACFLLALMAFSFRAGKNGSRTGVAAPKDMPAWQAALEISP